MIKNPLIPMQFENVKSSLIINKKSIKQEEVGYIMVNIYDVNGCSGNVSTVFSMPTNDCMVGNYNGVPVGSLLYTFLAAGDGYFEFATSIFNSLDCSGNADVSSMKIPTTCLEGDSSTSTQYYYTTIDPRIKAPPGILFNMFDTEDKCTQQQGNQFAWLNFNSCKSMGPDGSYTFNSCANNLFTTLVFSDESCKDFVEGITQPVSLYSCIAAYVDNNDDKMQTNNWQTLQCA
jgi:hypothetical protein